MDRRHWLGILAFLIAVAILLFLVLVGYFWDTADAHNGRYRVINPQESDIGRSVIYTGNRYSGGLLEVGVITSFNSRAVFVRYGDEKHARATNREDLEWQWK